MTRVWILGLALLVGIGLAGCKKQEAADAESDGGGSEVASAEAATMTVTDKSVEVGCASCVYEVEGVSGCDRPAAKIDGKVVLLTDTKINPHDEGLCSKAKLAKLTGVGKGEELSVSKLEWVPEG